MTEPANKVTLVFRGIATPAVWDEGRVTQVSFCTFDDREYPVVMDAAGCELLQYLRQSLLVEGHLAPNHGGEVLYVHRHCPADPVVAAGVSTDPRSLIREGQDT